MNRYNIKTLILLLISFMVFLPSTYAQESKAKITGIVYESGSGSPLQSVLVSTSGNIANTDEDGKFEIEVSNSNATLNVQFPGYTTRLVHINGRENLSISMVKSTNNSIDDVITTPTGDITQKNLANSVSNITSDKMSKKIITSFDQVLQGKFAGTQVISSSGMPGHKSYINIRGLSSLYGNNQPLLIIDGMIHQTQYANYGAIDGYTHNPMDIIDIDDIESISISSDANSHLGSKASNGVIYVNMEQRKETSSSITVNAYGGISLAPKQQSLLNSDQYRSLMNEQIASRGLSQPEIDNLYPFLSADPNSEEYQRYNNNTNWQDEIFDVGVLQKYHIFLKGGDNIATYNISTGYLTQEGILKNSRYSRYNVSVNGKVNITDKFSIAPNTKLSLSDSYMQEQGFNQTTNPIIAAQMKSPLMSPITKDANGNDLEFLDDVGAFNVSNPTAIIKNLEGQNRNYHFLTSMKAEYKINRKLSLSTLVGIDFNNSRDNIFIPDKGLTMIDSAFNSTRVLATEFRSTQNHNNLSYINTFNETHNLTLNLGHRYVNNSYEYDMGKDLNSATDDFKSLGQGADNQELRSIEGKNRIVKWVSYYGKADYSFLDKYYLTAGLSLDGTSALHKNSRYNFYPSLSGAWRLSSESFISDITWVDDLKFKLSYGITGNMNNPAYDYSHLYYRGNKFGPFGVIARESVPNPDLEMEKKSTISTGLDVSLLGQALNMHLNYYQTTVNNLIIAQTLPPALGFTTYYDNGGVLKNSGIEFAFDYLKHFGDIVWGIGGNITTLNNQITKLDFIAKGSNKIITKGEGIELVTQEGNSMYSYYGFETNGVYATDEEAAGMIGPGGIKSKAGDIRFVDMDGDKVIDDKDKTVIGDPMSNIFGGIHTSINYKKIHFRADFSYAMGNDVYNHLKMLGQSMDLLNNQQEEVNDRWTSSNTNSVLPRAVYGDPNGNNVFSDRWIEDGSYIRLKDLTISYDLPVNAKIYKSLLVYLTASNLITFTNYSGYDPEFMLYNNPTQLGNDYGKMPKPRSFVIGIKLGL